MLTTSEKRLDQAASPVMMQCTDRIQSYCVVAEQYELPRCFQCSKHSSRELVEEKRERVYS